MCLSTGIVTAMAVVGQIQANPTVQPESWTSVLSTPSGLAICLLAMTLVATLVSVLTVVALNHRTAQAKLQASLQISEMETQLKQEMLERGMSADEVCRVLQTPLSSAPHGVTPVARQFETRSG